MHTSIQTQKHTLAEPASRSVENKVDQKILYLFADQTLFMATNFVKKCINCSPLDF